VTRVDHSRLWAEFLERYGRALRRRARERWEAASEEERAELATRALVDELLNLPDGGEEGA